MKVCPLDTLPETSLSGGKEVDGEGKTNRTRCLPRNSGQPQYALLETEINMPVNRTSAEGTSADRPVADRGKAHQVKQET